MTTTTLEALDRGGESVREAFLQPQPVGLTNIQCKVIGPYFTEYPTHRHPEAKLSELVSCTYECPADCIISRPDATPLVAEVGRTDEELDMDTMLLTSCVVPDFAPEDATPQQVLMAARDNLDKLGDEAREMYNRLSSAKAACIEASAIGHLLERCLSIGLVGKECYCESLTRGLLSMFDDDATLRSCADALGTSADRIREFRPYLATGLPVPQEAYLAMVVLSARLLGRPVVLYFGPDAPATYVAAPDPASGKTCRRPIIVWRNQRASSAVVTCASSEKVLFRYSGVLVCFPTSVMPEDVLELAKNDLEDECIVLNSSLEGTEFHIQSADENKCVEMQGYDPTKLCFRSFPGSYAYVADDADVAGELLITPGYGQDMSGALEHLQSSLALMENVTPVHVDADGHCLVHSLSRCLIGKEYLWHALRTQLFIIMQNERQKYVDFFKRNAMVAALEDEMDSIVRRADPDYAEEGKALTVGRGLGTEHLFVLSNILRRPILLLDSMNIPNPESFVFLPLLVPKEEIATKKLLVVGWSSANHQHYVPLIPVVGDKVATIAAGALPRSQEETPQYLVYSCPDDVSPNDLIKEYLEFTDTGAAVIGGEQAMDSRSWCQGVVDVYEKEHNLSIWAMHEVSRYLLKSGQLTATDLAVVKNVDIFDKLCVKIAKETDLFYCHVCTGTTDKSLCCGSKGTKIDMRTGRIDFKDAARMPIESVPTHSCCIYKHWNATPQVGVKSIVFARDVGSAFQVGRVEHIHPTGEFDIRFRAGKAAAVRYMCPQDDIMFGFPSDCAGHSYRFATNGLSAVCLTVYDADPRICTDPEKAATDCLQQVLPKIPVQQRTPGLIRTLTQGFRTEVEKLLTKFKAEIGQRSRMRQNMHQRSSASGGVQGVSPKRSTDKKVSKDAEGRTMQWQSRDPQTHEWVSYDENNSGYIEAAYQDGQPSQEIEIPGFGVFTIHFGQWLQENAKGYCRSVRRVALSPWQCPNCTVENEGGLEQCFICAGENVRSMRPESAFKVVGSKELNTQRSMLGLTDGADDDDDYDEAEYEKELEAVTAKATADPRLAAPSGELFLVAERGHPGRDSILAFPKDYGQNGFVFSEIAQRYVPLPKILTPQHELYSIIKRSPALTIAGRTLYSKWGVRWIEDPKTGEIFMASLMY